MQKHTPYNLLHKKLTGEINSVESNLLEKLMEVDVDAEYSALESELGDIWKQAEGYNPNVVFNANAAFAKFQDRIKSEQTDQSTEEQVQEQITEQLKDIKSTNEGQPAKVMRMKPFGKLLPLAASFLVLIIAAFALKGILADNMITQSAAGDYVLADGSTIWLNDNSEIKYPESFESDRTIELSGEAYFKVAKSGTPFMVTSAAGTVEALSTEFTVDTDGKNIEVSVVEGKVEFIHNGDKEIIGEKEKAFNQDGKIEKEKLATRNIANWRNEGLSFIADNLLTVVSDLEKHYDVDIILADTGVDTSCNNISSPNVSGDSSLESFFENTLDEIHELEYVKNEDGTFTINKFACSK